jgi:hypothetical protein
MQMATSKVENSAQVLSCQLKFAHDILQANLAVTNLFRINLKKSALLQQGFETVLTTPHFLGNLENCPIN